MSRHSVEADDVAELMKLFADLGRRAELGTGRSYRIITIQEAGRAGFWLHRVLQREGIESHVVDPASIATPRGRRRAKTDRLDGETLLRALLAYKRGEPRVCAMVVAPSVEEEVRRRPCRERRTLIAERIEHVHRIKGVLCAQGISDYAPLRGDRRARLKALRTGDGRELPSHLKAQISRELDRLELLLTQIEAVEAEQDALLAEGKQPATPDPASMLLALKGMGANFAAVLWSEAFYRQFANPPPVAPYAGLAAAPWRRRRLGPEPGGAEAGH